MPSTRRFEAGGLAALGRPSGYPKGRARIISDNGSAFIARDFETFIREAGMTHVRTSPYYPQSNGKIGRFHRTLKHDAIRRFEPSEPEQARQVIARFVEHYNHVRLHSAIGYVTAYCVTEPTLESLSR